MSKPRPRLVVTKQDLQNPAIDRALRADRAAMPAEPDFEANGRAGFLYTTWFYLLLAGALGAFIAWAIVEPGFTDELEFAGVVKAVEPTETPKDFYLPNMTMTGRVTVAGVNVYAVDGLTKILDEKGSPLPNGIAGFSVGDAADVEGASAPDGKSMIAIQIARRSGPYDGPSTVSLRLVEAAHTFWSFALFPFVAALVGLAVGAAEGLVCRTFTRALRCGAVGLVAGLVGGFVALMFAGLIYEVVGAAFGDGSPTDNSGMFVLQIIRRGLGWAAAGLAMGLGQGIALKSGRLLVNGLIGGLVGGLFGGLLFDPLNLLIAGKELSHGAEFSRAIGVVLIGAAVGLMIGITEMLTRDAWLRVLAGPLRGKEFSFSRTPIRIGSSPKNEIYLFKDERIDPVHAEIHAGRDAYEIVDGGSAGGTLINGTPITRHRLVDGDTIAIGGTEFAYSTRDRARARPARPGTPYGG